MLIAICSGTVEISYQLLLRSGLLIHLEAPLLCIHVVFGGRQMGSKAAFPLPSLTVQSKDEPNQTWLKQAPWRALAFFAKSSGSNAARVAFPTGRTLPDNRRGDHMTGAPEQNETVASATRKSVKAGSREKLAQGRRRDEPVWWNEGSHLLKGGHRNAVMEPREATSEEPDRSITSKTWLLRWGTMKTPADHTPEP